MAFCLTAGALMIAIPANTFVLGWTHSVERTLWQESWRVDGATLVLDEASVRSSGAGMDPGVGARLEGGAWRYRPSLPPLQRLRLAHSEFAGDYRLCWRDNCEMLASLIVQGGAEAVVIHPCDPAEPDPAEHARQAPPAREPAPAPAAAKEIER